MSGGRFNYQNDIVAQEIYGWYMSPDYGEHGFSQAKSARKVDPFEDKQISELIWDTFCLMHSLDWYQSGDTSEDTYLKDIKFFKNKWLKPSGKRLVRMEIDKSIAELREDLEKTLTKHLQDENSESLEENL